MTPFALSVPGNLLLAGEYAVTLEGGLGITLGTEPRMVLHARPSGRWQFLGTGPWGSSTWSPSTPREAPNLFQGVWNRLSFTPAAQPWEIFIDSTPFHYPDGRKIGLGSSAATVALTTAALLVIQGHILPGSSLTSVQNSAFLPAVLAHRDFQGGRGSGYDVAASLFGLPGVFTGGQTPSWSPLPLPLPPDLRLLAGPQTVRTTKAVGGFSGWRQSNPQAAEEFLKTNNRLIAQIQTDPPQFWPILNQLTQLGRALGENLGVPADLPRETEARLGLTNQSWKALGAGNELILSWTPGPEGLKLQPAKEGLRWEQAGPLEK